MDKFREKLVAKKNPALVASPHVQDFYSQLVQEYPFPTTCAGIPMSLISPGHAGNIFIYI
jgi:hypothetical protein